MHGWERREQSLCPSSAVRVSPPPAARPEPSRGTPTSSSIHTAQEQHPRAPGQHPWAPQVTPIHASTVSQHTPGTPEGSACPQVPSPDLDAPGISPRPPTPPQMLQQPLKRTSIAPMLQIFQQPP